MSKCPCCITCPSSGAIIYNSWTPSRNELGCNISVNNADLIKTNKIWKRVQMPSSQHILRLSTLTSGFQQNQKANANPIYSSYEKHGSYARYLDKKKFNNAKKNSNSSKFDISCPC